MHELMYSYMHYFWHDAVSYPPPNDIYLVEAGPSQLIFQWSSVSSSCHVIQYRIVAVNCGQCPNITTNNTASCTGIVIDGHQCMFALRTIVCDDTVGDVSREVSVTLRGMSLEHDYAFNHPTCTCSTRCSSGCRYPKILSHDKKAIWPYNKI